MRIVRPGDPDYDTITYTPSPPRPAKATAALQLAPQERLRLREHLGTHPGYQPGPAGTSDLTSTCAGIPFRHKISSGVRRQPSPKLIPALTGIPTTSSRSR
jgi:hypothetical protein